MLIRKASFFIFNKLNYKLKALSGTNNSGRKTLYHRGGSVKKNYRVVDFLRYICHVPAMVTSIEYDPNRTSFITLLAYSNGAVAYALASQGIKSGLIVSTIFKKNTILQLGDTGPLNLLKPGIYINTLEVRSGSGAKSVRAGGVFAKLVSLLDDNFAIVKLKSKTLLRVNAENLATVGSLLVPFRQRLFKAGQTRFLGWRPHVRGVAMNPIDHPHGGGQGKTSGGRPSVTPWALMTKGRKTKRKLAYGKTSLKG